MATNDNDETLAGIWAENDGYHVVQVQLAALKAAQAAPPVPLKTCERCGMQTAHLMTSSYSGQLCARCYEDQED